MKTVTHDGVVIENGRSRRPHLRELEELAAQRRKLDQERQDRTRRAPRDRP